MFIFKILLIILVAAPFIALASYFYLQMLGIIREKNRNETVMITKSLEETADRKNRTGRKNNRSKSKGKSRDNGGRR